MARPRCLSSPSSSSSEPFSLPGPLPQPTPAARWAPGRPLRGTLVSVSSSIPSWFPRQQIPSPSRQGHWPRQAAKAPSRDKTMGPRHGAQGNVLQKGPSVALPSPGERRMRAGGGARGLSCCTAPGLSQLSTEQQSKHPPMPPLRTPGLPGFTRGPQLLAAQNMAAGPVSLGPGRGEWPSMTGGIIGPPVALPHFIPHPLFFSIPSDDRAGTRPRRPPPVQERVRPVHMSPTTAPCSSASPPRSVRWDREGTARAKPPRSALKRRRVRPPSESGLGSGPSDTITV